MLYHLTQEADDSLGAILVHVRQIDFITEHHQPFPKLNWGQDDAIGGLPVLAVMVEGLEDQLWCRGTGEVEADHLQVRQRSQGREEGHGLTRTWRTTQDQRLVFSQPGVQQSFVSDGVYRGYHYVWSCHLVSLYLHAGYLVRPQEPLSIDGHLVVNDRGVGIGWKRDGGAVADEVSHIAASLELAISCEAPQEGVDQGLGDISGDENNKLGLYT